MMNPGYIPETLMFSGWEEVLKEVLGPEQAWMLEATIRSIKNGTANVRSEFLIKLYERHPCHAEKL